MKQHISKALIIGGLSLACAGLALQAQAQIKIGFMATLSGPSGALGQDQYDAFMLGIEHAGGKLGGQAVTVIKEDDQLKPDIGVQIVQKLLEKEKVHIVTGVTFSNVMMAVSKPLAEANMYFVGSNAGPAPLAGAACNANFVFTSWQNDQQSEVMGAFANEKGYKKVITMAPNYQAGKDFVAGFKRYFKGQTMDEIYTQLNQPDYSAEIAQVTSAKPDAIFVFYPGGMGVNFVKQYNQSGSKIPVLSTSTVDGSTLPALKESALGMYSGTFWGPDFNNATSKKFVEDFEKKYNRIPSQYAAQGYESALLIDAALRKTNGNVADKAAFRAALRSADYKSLRGNLKFGVNGFPIQDMHVFEVAKDGKGRVSLKTVATPLKSLKDPYADSCVNKS